MTIEGSPQETVTVDNADSFSKVIKRTVVRSEGDHREVSLDSSHPPQNEDKYDQLHQ